MKLEDIEIKTSDLTGRVYATAGRGKIDITDQLTRIGYANTASADRQKLERIEKELRQLHTEFQEGCPVCALLDREFGK